MAVMGAARAAVRAAAATAAATGTRLADTVPREIVDDIFAHALKKQTGVSLKYMVRGAGKGAGGQARGVVQRDAARRRCSGTQPPVRPPSAAASQAERSGRLAS